MITLIKLSSEGWEKGFLTEEECRQELLNWVCNSCLKELKTDTPSLEDLLCTSCGAEFMIEDVDG